MFTLESTECLLTSPHSVNDHKQMVDNYTDFAARFQVMLDLAGLTRPDFAAKFPNGSGQQMITNWLKRGRVGAQSVPLVRELTGISVEWLNEGIGAPKPDGAVRVPAYEIEAVEDGEGFDPTTEVWVLGVDIEVGAGDGRVTPEFIPTNYRQRFTLRWLDKTGTKADDLRIMGVRGHSMERTIFDGDKVVLDLNNTKIVSNHVYVIIVGEEAKVKRLFRAADGRIRIVSDNSDKATYPDEFVESDNDRFLVVGRVIDKSGPGGL